MIILLSIFVFVFACYGASNQIINSPGPFGVWEAVRWVAYKIHSSLGYLFTCMRCLPTWMGIILSLIDIFILKNINLTPSNILLGGQDWLLAVILDGAIASGSAYLLYALDNFLTSNSPEETLVDVNDDSTEFDISELMKDEKFQKEIIDIVTKQVKIDTKQILHD